MADFGQTAVFKLPYPNPSASDNVPRDVQALAAATETALGSVGGTGAMTFIRVGTVLVQVIETRPDGSRVVDTLSYVNDRLVQVARTNPTRTEMFTYDATSGALTGYSVA